jgi:UDP-N-acetylglucosamine:LPS N-acetylglucosamine transferase
MRTDQVVVVTGSYGAGHDVAADAITHQLEREGHEVRRLDVAEELPWRIGIALRFLYFLQLRVAPTTWGATLCGLERDGLLHAAVRRLLGLLGRRLVRHVEGADLVVSTHPFAAQVLGEARRTGRLSTPTVTYLTDASVHRLWIHPDVDVHVAIHATAAEQAEALGGHVVRTRPAVVPAVTPADWHVPWDSDRPVALVVGGSCGVGDLLPSALDLLATGLVAPVVACGGNERLRQQVEEAGLVALGWRDDLPTLVAAADLVVQNSGGMTTLETLAGGTPLMTYRPIPGHGETNAAALEEAGLAPWARDADELPATLARLLAAHHGPGLPHDAPALVDALVAHGLLTGAPVEVAA